MSRSRAVLAAILFASITPPLLAENPFLVANLNRTSPRGSSRPENFLSLGSQVLFEATDPTSGRELWRTDGTPEGTWLVADLKRSIQYPSFNTLAVHHGTVYFETDTGAFLKQLWRTDGTAEGTIQLTRTPPSDPLLDTRFIGAIGESGKLVFKAKQNQTGAEVWITDGTPTGTRLLRDILVGTEGSQAPRPEGIGLSRWVVFRAFDYDRGAELWRTDGTSEGTELLSDLLPGPDSSAPEDFFSGGAGAIFRARGEGGGEGIWWTDGRPEGTRRIIGVPAGGEADIFWAVPLDDGRLVFLAETSGSRNLWATDGSGSGTIQLTAFQPAGTISSRPPRIGAFGGSEDQIFFTADDGIRGLELWKSDGTVDGTRLAVDLCPGPCSSIAQVAETLSGRLVLRGVDASKPSGEPTLWLSDGTPDGTKILRSSCVGTCLEKSFFLGSTGSIAFFTFRRDDNQYEIWRTDGSGEGTFLLATVEPALRGSVPILGFGIAGEFLVFSAKAGSKGVELWASDGTVAGTGLIKDVFDQEDGSSVPQELVEYDGKLYFVADDGANARGEMWGTDGTAEGTFVLTDVVPQQEGDPLRSFVYAIKGIRGLVFFRVVNGGVWRTDGTPQGTLELVPFEDRSLAGPLAGGQFGDLGERAVFFANSQLWISDGSLEGTHLLSSNVSPSWSYSASFVERGDFAYFIGEGRWEDRRLAGAGIWRTDGTPEGTDVFWHKTGNYHPISLTEAGGSLYFVVWDGIHQELWTSDGTFPGTRRVRDDLVEVGRALVPFGERILFEVDAFNPANGAGELWISNGQPEGTQRLTDASIVGASTEGLVVAGGRAFFSGIEGPTDQELWATDGTVAGTMRVADLWPGEHGSEPSSLVNGGSVLYFTAGTPVHGRELWVTDGTGPGTVRLTDIAEGAKSGDPGPVTRVGNRLYMQATDGRFGRELWALDLGDGTFPPGDGTPPPPGGAWLTSAQIDGFRFKARITGSDGTVITGTAEAACISETLCVSGAIRGRSEVFVRIVGPKPNGRLWPTLVKFTTSTVEVWIEQNATGLVRYYRLEGAVPGSSDLPGLFDRDGFLPPGG